MRVDVVIHRAHRSMALCRWAWRLARAFEAELTILWGLDVTPETRIFPSEDARGDDDTMVGAPAGAMKLYADLMVQSGARHPLLATLPDSAPPLPVPDVKIVCPGGSEAMDAILDRVKDDPPDILVVAPPEGRGRNSVARSLVDVAPCRTILLRSAAGDAQECGGVLVATAGGPSARAALRLGEKLAMVEGVEMEPLYVQTPMENGEAVGRATLSKILDTAGVADKAHVRPRVIVGSSLPDAIEEAAEAHDLVLLGASHVGVVRSLLFGTVPEKLLSQGGGVTVGVVREGWSSGERLRARLGRWLDLRIPQLDREQRVDLYRRLESGSAWSFDFMLLMALSTSIAALGLLQNSAAVVIGAMLVAPLMTPILGVGLALLQGNTQLLSSATRALFSGYLLALALSALCGAVAPPATLTGELLARGGPTLLDMGVALLSGVAAAYCLGRPGLLAALPGVAIAAALVPPIATTGIALATGEMSLARGASLLFGTNVVAIVLGAAMSLFAVGVRAGTQLKPAQRRARLLIGSLLLLLAAFAVPLTAAFKEARRGNLTDTIVQKLHAEARDAGVEFVSITCADRPCRVTIASDRPLDAEATGAIARSFQDHIPGRPPIRLTTEIAILAP
ncbi:MAG: DUF389 domain-containing protein [Acidobacteriota bacterium]